MNGNWQTLLEEPPLALVQPLLGEPEASGLLAVLDRELSWECPELTLFGRTHPIPRRQCWMGDPEARYRYSGREFIPQAWHPAVAALRERVMAVLADRDIGIRFNSVLLNRYADGRERMGWHSDDEPELGDAPLIAAISLGAERPLRFRWREDTRSAFNVPLPHDSLLCMGPGVQRRLQHALLPRATVGLRISLTFRTIHV